MIRKVAKMAIAILCLFGASPVPVRAALPAGPAQDPVLRAMVAEMERSKSELKLEGVGAPYYIDYRIVDQDKYVADAVYGAVRTELRNRMRYLRVVVRLGDYTQDSFYQGGEGIAEIAGVDNDELALRHTLWLATDQAYKAAAEALTAKKAALKQLTIEHPVDDFAHAEPVHLIGPLVALDPKASSWLKALKDASAFYRRDPQLESVGANLSFEATNRYFVNSEGAIVRTGQSVYSVAVAASTQAADGMKLERSADFVYGNFKDLPAPEKFEQHAEEVLGTLRQLRDAPVVDEEYRGPVLFSGDSATHVVADFVGENVLGVKPALGQPARTRGAFSSSYQSKVLPDFLSVVDDPTISSWKNEPLLGNYEVDDEGVKAVKVSLIDKGKLVAYVTGREPIRDFPASNGHGRARYPANAPSASLGNLILQSSEPLADDAMKAKLLEMCKQRDLAFGYFVKASGPKNSPRMLYKVFVSDGHEELVRGATFGDLDARALRNDIVAAGDTVSVENRPTNIPHSIASPSLLFDELVVKRVDQNKEKLPEYPAPQLAK
jgi:predicted Zn-dependent protease